MQEYFSNMTDSFLNSVPNILIALGILALSYYAGNWLSRLLSRVLHKRNAESGVSNLLSQILKWVMISFGLISALQRFFDVTAFLTGLGILGFTVGFALQNIMQNFVSGVLLLLQQPFKAGDIVSIDGFDGMVLKIDLRTTEIKALDGRIVFLPNADVLAQPIVNYTRADLRRVELPVRVAYDSDPEEIRRTILSELPKISGYIDTPEPLVLFNAFGDISIDLAVYFWVDTTVVLPAVAKDTALTLVKKAFETRKIKIPHFMQDTESVQKIPARVLKTKK